MDLRIPIGEIVAAKERRLIGTGISVSLPEKHSGLICGRSGWSLRGLMVLQAVLDSDYTGEIKISVSNITDNDILLCAGDRIALLVVMKVEQIRMVEMDL